MRMVRRQTGFGEHGLLYRPGSARTWFLAMTGLCVAACSSSTDPQPVTGPVDADLSRVFVDRPVGVFADGQDKAVVSVMLKDGNFNPVRDTSVELRTDEGAATIVQPAAGTDEAGVASGTVTATVPGAVQVRAVVVPGELEVGHARVVFVEGSLDPTVASASNSSVEVTPDVVLPADGSSAFQIVVTVRDDRGVPLENQDVVVQVSGLSVELTVQAGRTNSEGVFTTEASSTREGPGTVISRVQSGDLAVTLQQKPEIKFITPRQFDIERLDPSSWDGWAVLLQGYALTDLNGDQELDLLLVSTMPGGDCDNWILFDTYMNDNDGSAIFGEVTSKYDGSRCRYVECAAVAVSEDTLTKRIAATCRQDDDSYYSDPRTYLWSFDGSSFDRSERPTSQYLNEQGSRFLRFVDMAGDGVDDLVEIQGNIALVHPADPAGYWGEAETRYVTFDTGQDAEQYDSITNVTIADVTGDNHADVVMSSERAVYVLHIDGSQSATEYSLQLRKSRIDSVTAMAIRNAPPGITYVNDERIVELEPTPNSPPADPLAAKSEHKPANLSLVEAGAVAAMQIDSRGTRGYAVLYPIIGELWLTEPHVVARELEGPYEGAFKGAKSIVAADLDGERGDELVVEADGFLLVLH